VATHRRRTRSDGSRWTRFGAWLERAIRTVSPHWSFRREQFRAARDVLFQLSAYRGARSDRLRSHWVPGKHSADTALLTELPDLRERSRDLYRNDPHAAGILDTFVANVVGTGLRPQSLVSANEVDISEERVQEFQRAAERAWARWVRYADAGERLSFYDIQGLLYRQRLESGEGLALPARYEKSWRPYELAIQVIEPDRLNTPYKIVANADVRAGVEIGERGEAKGYWIQKEHPGDSWASRALSEYDHVVARDADGRPQVFHLYRPLRPGQSRGVPILAPVILTFKDLGDYLEAELVAARLGACFGLIVVSDNPYGAASNANSDTNTEGQRLEEFEPGMVRYLAPGQDVRQVIPQRPGGTFDTFMERVLRSIGAGVNLPLELVLKDFSKTNYSSARAALLEARRFFRCEQVWLIDSFCQPVWELFLEEAFLRGELPARDFYKHREAYTRAAWRPTLGWGWVDPTKEIEAELRAVDGNVRTLSDVCSQHGNDWEEVMEQRAREEGRRMELGLPERRQPVGRPPEE